MNILTQGPTDRSLLPIIEKVENGQRLTIEDGLTLYNSPDLLTIGQMANAVNLKKNRTTSKIENGGQRLD